MDEEPEYDDRVQAENTTGADRTRDFALTTDLAARSVQKRGRQVASTQEPLFHYTSAFAFERIISNGDIWLTNAAYLNDQGELTYPIAVGPLALHQVRQSRTSDVLGVVFGEASRLLAYHSIFKSFYVSSFSSHGNQLSQWRAYCPRGGYSFGVPGEHLASLVSNKSAYQFGPVEYEPRKQLEALKRLITDHLQIGDEARAHHQDVPSESYAHHLARTIALAMTDLFVFFKSKAFEEEGEWRLVRHVPEESTPGFFERHGVLTPYFTHSINASNGRVPLHQVSVSPLSDQDLAAHSAHMLLSGKGYELPERLVITPNFGLRFAP